MTIGNFDAGTIVYSKFTTFQPSTGAPFTLAGTPAISVYKDNSTTQSVAGVTLVADFDGLAGFNHVTIDTSADGAFYAAGHFFDIVITTGTVDGVSSVGVVVGRFTIGETGKVVLSSVGLDQIVMSDITAVPSMTGTLKAAINWLYAIARNKRTQTSTTETLLKTDGTTSVATSAKSDDGTTFTRGMYS